MLAVSCSTLKPKYFASDRVEFKWSDQGEFWSKICLNVAYIENFHINTRPFGSDYVIYSTIVECQGSPGAIIYKELAIEEAQIIRYAK